MKKKRSGHPQDNHSKKSIDLPLQGIVSINSKGVGYLKNPLAPKEDDLEIQNNFLNTALHGDEVKVIIHPKIKGKRLNGEVIEIIKRAKTNFVGVLEETNGNAFFLVPDDRKMYIDIFIPKEKALDAKNGEKVLATILQWKDRKKSPEGKVLKVIGQKGDHDVEMESIVLEKGFDTDFPETAVREAEMIEKNGKVISAEEISRRKDFRGTFTCTIDPVDAKDFDDALSFKKLPNGNFQVGIHIADVSHYVRPGSALDIESRKRGFSVYLVDRTIPMLPHALSNDICSLNPKEDKLTFSAVFEITKDADIKSRWFGRTIIHSNKRFSYEEAQGVLDGKKADLGGRTPKSNYFEELNTLNELALVFKKKKIGSGAIDFETTEVKFVLDEKGKPIEVIKKERLETHKLVEEFMLLANKEVAEYIHKEAELHYQNKDIGIYRIHDLPDKDKIAELSIFLKALGYELVVRGKKISPKDVQALLNKVEGKAEESLIKTATIRSMAKAIYSTKNIGHFGLAFDYYTHFTSPIRRYPDLLVHRTLYDILEHRKISSELMAFYYTVSAESSRREIAAADAERSSIKYKQVEYMSEHIGEIYDGIISGVTDWGIYVEEISTKSEGMVKLRNLKDDFYVFDQKNYAIVGQKTKNKYTLGDKVKIKVAGADLERKTLDYQFVE